jgi:hypothetical protein
LSAVSHPASAADFDKDLLQLDGVMAMKLLLSADQGMHLRAPAWQLPLCGWMLRSSASRRFLDSATGDSDEL